MSSRDKEPSKPSGNRTRGIRTLSDLKQPGQPGSSRGPDEPQEYYTGGEKSGMIVQDPSKGYNADRIFDQARRLGAVQRPLEDLPPSSSSRSFTGMGRSLSGATAPTPPQQPESVSVVQNVVFWINGFTINDGPLRRFDDPENAPFLESIMRSEVPKELEHADRRSPVPVNLIRRAQNYPEPEARRAPFRGAGRTLGSNSSTTVSAPATAVSTPLHNAPSPCMGLVVDRSLPSTSIQLRLADGTRMVAHFNYHHTIADIRAFINASRPGRSRSYQLQTVGFPPKVLTDATQTIKEAGLLNSVVNQKL